MADAFQACDTGPRRLLSWKDRPRHDEASHGADAFLTFACSGYIPPSVHRRYSRKTEHRHSAWAVEVRGSSDPEPARSKLAILELCCCV